MDWIRTCGTTRVRLWADSDEWTEIRWFRADPDARVFESPHRYPWTENLQTDGEPKVAPPWLDPVWRYEQGSNWAGYRGHEFCGRPEAFATGGLHGVDPEIPTDVDGIAECCRPAERDGTGRIVWGGAGRELETGGRSLIWAGGAEEPDMAGVPWERCGTGEDTAIYTVPADQALRLRFFSLTEGMGPSSSSYTWEFRAINPGPESCRIFGDFWDRDFSSFVWDGQLWVAPGAILQLVMSVPAGTPSWYVSGELVAV